MKKFFKETKEHQFFSPESYKSIFGIDAPEEINKSPMVCLLDQACGDYEVQVLINDIPVYENNRYVVLVYSAENFVFSFSYQSHTVLPPVWDRTFGDMDYTDWLGIQKMIAERLEKVGLRSLEFDLEPQGKSFFFIKERAEEAYRLIKEGGSYSILCVFAEKQEQWVEDAKKWFGF